ncbi:sensor histidine kinase [Sporolactobacillus kofuensis]|uniref:histidine kinase n=1 Tax=Sporolactobacillus kofuensis TaxID=269672 RepID=A0ABW1WCN8_9BACL|nr:sensor histidine kinase [Sporolactobacillus kofuensis]MCO7175237.1 sensor histidine kinase [Sporolactobacillus kofuensis]
MHKGNRLIMSFNSDSFVASPLRIATVLWSIAIYIGSLMLQHVYDQSMIGILAFTLILVVPLNCFLFWFSFLFTKKWVWLYFILHGGLVFTSALLIPNGSPVLLIGLIPIIVAQSMTVFHEKRKALVIFCIFYSLYCIVIGVNYGPQRLPMFILIFLLILVIVSFYSIIYSRQVDARMRMEYYVRELEAAQLKVEELTLANERHRIARDLHDTLAQGLAGLIMQLEAVDAHLQKENYTRAKEIIKQSMIRARETLSNARLAIDNLRAEVIEKVSFEQATLKKIKEFTNLTSIQTDYKVDPLPKLSSLKLEHMLYIFSECLANVAKHAKAKNVKIVVKVQDRNVIMRIEDDGIGFKMRASGNNEGKYGLLGLRERTRLVDGKIDVTSVLGKGTKIKISVPI